jgi:hypothetical protein
MTTSDYSPAQAIEDVKGAEAASSLANYLRRGQVTLLLGAGVSKGLGLPDWKSLVERCEAALGVDPGATDESSATLMRRIDDCKDVATEKGASFLDIVHNELYRDLGAEGTYPDSVLTRRMLIALGALTMSSSRGSVSDVLTLNFDDALEWYLELHGFRTQVVVSVPEMARADVDVRVHHIHGFLPLDESVTRSTGILFSYQELLERLRESGTEPWSVLLASQLQSRVLLVVGSSMRDIDLEVHLSRTKALLEGSRPVGYVITAQIDRGQIRQLERLGMVPVSLPDHDAVADFLLGVCRAAAH